MFVALIGPKECVHVTYELMKLVDQTVDIKLGIC